MRTGKALALLLLIIPYLLYVAFVIRADRGPVDYETFMGIGQRLLSAANPYGPNSYYPLPFVLLFALLAALPRALSMAIWLISPLAVFLVASGWQPWVLLFAPVFGHFVGGQADIFAVLGLWGFRKNAYGQSGVWLALTLFKPQLALVPLGYAVITWLSAMRRTKAIPKPLIQFLAASAVIYLPAFALMPDWPIRWLSSPRPLFERAMSAALPRTLLAVGVRSDSTAYWLVLFVAALILLALVYYLGRRCLSLDLSIAWGFVVSPLVHDYDLVQLIPLLDTGHLRLAAILSSLPGWLVIIFMYGNDKAWYVYSLIAPVILVVMMWSLRRQVDAGTDKYDASAEQLAAADPASARKGQGASPAKVRENG